ALVSLMSDVQARRVCTVQVDTAVPSPFASSLAFAYVASFMYEGDAPMAERRAQALTLDRRMLAELVGSEELRELIDPAALADLEAELQALDERRWARSVDGAHDILRRLGDLREEELDARSAGSFGPELLASRRAVEVVVAGEPRLGAAGGAGRTGCAGPVSPGLARHREQVRRSRPRLRGGGPAPGCPHPGQRPRARRPGGQGARLLAPPARRPARRWRGDVGRRRIARAR